MIKRALLLSTVLLGLTSVAPAQTCEELSDQLDGVVMFRLQAGCSPIDVMIEMHLVNPNVFFELTDQIPGRDIYRVDLTVPGSWDENDWEDLEDEFKHWTGPGGVVHWIEFSAVDEAPEGGTGSTFVDSPISIALFKTQYVTTKLGLTIAHQFAQGQGTVVAILDTGVDPTHPALASSLLSGIDFIDGDAFPIDEGNNIDDDGDGAIDEMTGHGTYVAGLVKLVAPETRILPIRVLDSEGRGDVWTLAKGIYYAIDQGVEVINLSLGSTEDSDVIEEALEEAQQYGIAVVAAAGNCAQSSPKIFPAMKVDFVIGVAAVDDNDFRASFTNYNQNLKISAPAVSVYDENGDPIYKRSVFSTIPGGGFAAWEGTSMAAPLVAGTAALIRSQHPEWDCVPSTIDQVTTAITTGSFPIDSINFGYNGFLGEGRVDAQGSVALGPPAPQLADLNADGTVNLHDLLIIIGDWGMTHSSADLDGDGIVKIFDILVLIANWS